MKRHTPTSPLGPLVLVDGEPSGVNDSAGLFTAAGFEVVSYTDPLRALRVFDLRPARWKPTAFLVDLILPGISGYELARRLDDRLSTMKVPLIMMGRYPSPEDHLEVFNVGAKGLLQKPLTPEMLLEKLQAIRERESKQQSLLVV